MEDSFSLDVEEFEDECLEEEDGRALHLLASV